MSLFSKLFGAGSKPEPEVQAEIYKGFRIVPDPQSCEGGYRLGARIEKEIAGEVKVYDLRRADVLRSVEDAEGFSVRKAKQVIDEQGEAIFG
ncbi:Transcriptional activator HlyU [Roseovarius litorisediminis]|uniref:Transcriptional activator HlyU n=1 Tax=Roseovarius litorisediminis TaxID=1312363 RepID=A0A1Y5S4N9_9RHOB|nr:HlyU family transcriptional regulator [Roseovarius litorisediminis]SLN32275.1 Transcriptional activator HlyU [Roseovarius litorisediminis]